MTSMDRRDQVMVALVCTCIGFVGGCVAGRGWEPERAAEVALSVEALPIRAHGSFQLTLPAEPIHIAPSGDFEYLRFTSQNGDAVLSVRPIIGVPEGRGVALWSRGAMVAQAVQDECGDRWTLVVWPAARVVVP